MRADCAGPPFLSPCGGPPDRLMSRPLDRAAFAAPPFFVSGNVTTGLAHFKAKAGTGDRFRHVELFQK